MKTLILTTILLVLPWMVSAECVEKVYHNEKDSLSRQEILAHISAIGDMVRGLAHDTTKEYIEEIREVCDTTFKYNRRCLCMFDHITCHTDTIWGDKVQVWLTPREIKYLWQIVYNADSVLISVFHLLREVMPDNEKEN